VVEGIGSGCMILSECLLIKETQEEVKESLIARKNP
jgi:hypothetical protein